MFDALPPFARRLDALSAGAVLLILLWAALAPVQGGSRERLVTIPAGTSALLAAGGRDDGLPSAITLTLGVEDVLLLKNADQVPQQFGPVALAPGEQFRLPFEQAGEYPVAASAWADRRFTVKVVEWPAPGWERLSWRVAALIQALRYLPKQAPTR
jgi:hypothetical protein